MGKIYVVGLGCNPENDLTKKACSVLSGCDAIVCNGMVQSLLNEHKEKMIITEKNAVAERCRIAKQLASEGKSVALACMGDPGVYGVASLVLEEVRNSNITVEIVPGITACLSGAAIIGAPLMQDFAVITLSEGLQKSALDKLRAALDNNFIVVLYGISNKSSYLFKALEIIRELRPPETAIGIAIDIGDAEQKTEALQLCDLACDCITQRSILFIGNSSTYLNNNRMITPLV